MIKKLFSCLFITTFFYFSLVNDATALKIDSIEIEVKNITISLTPMASGTRTQAYMRCTLKNIGSTELKVALLRNDLSLKNNAGFDLIFPSGITGSGIELYAHVGADAYSVFNNINKFVQVAPGATVHFSITSRYTTNDNHARLRSRTASFSGSLCILSIDNTKSILPFIIPDIPLTIANS